MTHSTTMTSAGFVQAGGHSLEYAFEPPPSADAPVILLLHEGLGCAQLWGGFKAALADVCRKYRLDWTALKPDMRAQGRFHVETY